MKNLLEQKLFPYVIKPGRYSGGEPGSIVKDAAGKVSYLHVYPDKYDVGQAYPGIQTLYQVINSDDRFLCERAFAVDSDAEEIMRREKIPLFSLESSRPAKEFDAIGFTLPFELVYTNVLNMLDLTGLPLLASERDESSPLILAGGPSAYNPEPMAPFIDLFFIGDAEIGLPKLLELIEANRNKSRKEVIEIIVEKIPSVYAPSLYDLSGDPVETYAPEIVTGEVVRELKPEYYPDQPILPLIETAHAHLPVEIMRGCPQGCRFCMAGTIYRPVRLRSKEEILRQIDKQLGHTGYEEVSLLSLSSSDYPDIEPLAVAAANRLEKRKISITLPSLRPGTISGRLLNAVKKVRNAGLTISPEAGTERLRLFIRKEFPDEAIYDTARLAFEKGWTTLKLYFMVGLPTETDEDLLGIAHMTKKISELGRSSAGRKTINVTLSPFVPKPHTPFQWDEILPPDEILRRIQFVKRNTRGGQINYKYPLVESSLLQGILGRGNRDLHQVILDVFKAGGRFDGWNEGFDYKRWVTAFEKNGISINDKLNAIPFSEKLPWRRISKGFTADHLLKERQRTSLQLKEYTPQSRDEDAGEAPVAMSFGRSKKKVATRQSAAPTKNRVRFRWSKNDRYRYMGHLDNLRLIERSLRIANLPVSYSQGFNPSMKLSFGPPLSLGFTSETEVVDILFETGYMPYMGDALRKALPPGIEILEAKVVMDKAKAISSLINRAVYTASSQLFTDIADMKNRIDKLLNTGELIVVREGKNKTTELDIRPAIYDLSLGDELFTMELGMADGGYAKPMEVVKILLDDDFDDYMMYRFHRKAMYRVDENNEALGLMDL